jgi:hypothetical protein
VNIYRVANRDRKREKRRSGMRVDGKGIFLIQQKQWEKSQEIKKRREQQEKELTLNGDTESKS